MKTLASSIINRSSCCLSHASFLLLIFSSLAITVESSHESTFNAHYVSSSEATDRLQHRRSSTDANVERQFPNDYVIETDFFIPTVETSASADVNRPFEYKHKYRMLQEANEIQSLNEISNDEKCKNYENLTENNFNDSLQYFAEEREANNWSAITIFVLKAIVMVVIIVTSILGNALVIVSVGLHRRLHSNANYLLVSLATADLLVALCAMTFNASVELSGGFWLFGQIMCDLWNSFDVYFSTVSILHLCFISVDRYYAIVKPLEYPSMMTKKAMSLMLAHCWLAPACISFLPIFLGWYTTSEHLNSQVTHPHVCAFEVNAIFAVISSSVSFWIPCAVMIFMYFRIFQEARKQEQAILSRASSASSSTCNNSVKVFTQQEAVAAAIARQQLLIALQGGPFMPASRQQEYIMKNLSDASSTTSVTTSFSGNASSAPSGSSSSRSSSGGYINASMWRHQSRHGSSASWHGTCRNGSLIPGPRRILSGPLLSTKALPVGRREHKAARTLGMIMGAFVLCWLPFFSWYVTINICGPKCHCPSIVVTILFWIGYFNSTLNPFIYAYFRTDFRDAFHRTLTRLHCCRERQPAGVFV